MTQIHGAVGNKLMYGNATYEKLQDLFPLFQHCILPPADQSLKVEMKLDV